MARKKSSPTHAQGTEQMSPRGLTKGSWGVRGWERERRQKRTMEAECAILNHLTRESEQDEGQLGKFISVRWREGEREKTED